MPVAGDSARGGVRRAQRGAWKLLGRADGAADEGAVREFWMLWLCRRTAMQKAHPQRFALRCAWSLNRLLLAVLLLPDLLGLCCCCCHSTAPCHYKCAGAGRVPCSDAGRVPAAHPARGGRGDEAKAAGERTSGK